MPTHPDRRGRAGHRARARGGPHAPRVRRARPSATASTAARRGREAGWDLILLDLMLPRKDGFEVCQELRQAGVRTPIIMLTARTHEAEKVLGPRAGGRRLRHQALQPARAARADPGGRSGGPGANRGGTYRFGDCEVDFDRGEVRRDGAPSTSPRSSSGCSRPSSAAAAGVLSREPAHRRRVGARTPSSPTGSSTPTC